MSNAEGMYSARRELLCRTVHFIKRTEQSETTLRNSAVRHSIFCGLLFNLETYTICLSAHSLRQSAPLIKSTVFEEAYIINRVYLSFVFSHPQPPPLWIHLAGRAGL